MQFLFSEKGGDISIELKDEQYRYIVKVRRFKVSDEIRVRNLTDDKLYIYEISYIDRRKAILNLKESIDELAIHSKRLHLAWCMIEPKIIEKTLPSLNEIGVDKITFIYCDRSQRGFKLDINRVKKILINSSQQCGRVKLPQIDIIDSIDEFLKAYPDSYILDFSTKRARDYISEIETILVGCEGGFSQRERELFKDSKVLGLDTPYILRSETAVVSIASMILL